MKQIKDSQIYLISKFLTPKECKDLIQFGESKGFQSLSSYDIHSRTNKRVMFDDHKLAKRFMHKLEPYLKNYDFNNLNLLNNKGIY